MVMNLNDWIKFVEAKSQILDGKYFDFVHVKKFPNVNAPIPCLLAASVHHF